MTELTPGASDEVAPGDEAPARDDRFRVGALVVIGIALALLLWLVLRDDDDGSQTAPVAVSAAELQEFVDTAGHPVYWLGPRAGQTYELEREADGAIFIRYLPSGVEIGSEEPYLTVATYPYADAFEALQKVADEADATQLEVAGGGVAVASGRYPEGVHVAWPGLDFQVEVFDPQPGLARDAVAGGELTAVGDGGSASTKGDEPRVRSRAELEGFAASVGQPVYWAGPMAGRSYEVERRANGQIFIRYLPAGVEAGAEGGYLTVATYPFEDALAAVEALAREPGADRIELPNGGLAVVDAATPESIHLAFPGSDYQVEVFDPSAARAREIVSSGQITTVG
ncbi:MAG TPA: hypothetical protein VFR32_04170 [Gaiellaceae bacterium]|nr:hypothetical protein [Gaiellaceae bacterium]